MKIAKIDLDSLSKKDAEKLKELLENISEIEEGCEHGECLPNINIAECSIRIEHQKHHLARIMGEKYKKEYLGVVNFALSWTANIFTMALRAIEDDKESVTEAKKDFKLAADRFVKMMDGITDDFQEIGKKLRKDD